MYTHATPQVGVFERDPFRAAALIRGWLTDRRGELEAMAARAKALGQPHALANIVGDLATLVRGAGHEDRATAAGHELSAGYAA